MTPMTTVVAPGGTAEMTSDQPRGTRYSDRKAAGRRAASMEFPEDLYLRLQDRAGVEERSMAAITRQAVREYLDRHGR